MKKVFLLLVFFCTLSFSDVGGFEDLKWGASREEVKEYLMKNFDLNMENFLDSKDSFVVVRRIDMKSIKFSDITLKDPTFQFNKFGEFCGWSGETYTIKGDKTNIKKLLMKKFNLVEKKMKMG